MGMLYHFGCMWCIDTLHTTILGFGCDHAVNVLVLSGVGSRSDNSYFNFDISIFLKSKSVLKSKPPDLDSTTTDAVVTALMHEFAGN